jgi:hypothetical protein
MHIKAFSTGESGSKLETILGTPRPFLRIDRSLSFERNIETMEVGIRDVKELGDPMLSICTALNESGLFPDGSEPVTITCHARWEVLACCKEELDARYNLDEVVTFTGSPSNAQAASCIGYMQQTWPRTGEAMMKAFQRAISAETCGEFQPSLPLLCNINLTIRIFRRKLLGTT